MNVEQAEKAIGKILAQLESETQGLVDSLSIVDVNVTRLMDPKPLLLRRVVIELKRLPGTCWE